MQENTRENIKNITWLFLINPFSALIVAIRNYKTIWAKNVVWMFVAFFGFTIVLSNSGIDANRVKEALFSWHQNQIAFSSFIGLLYSGSGNSLDVVQPLLMYFVSRFTSNYRILFALYGLIFGFFYSRNIWYLIDHAIVNIKQLNIILLITFSFIVGFWNINGFRMWTASQVFFFGAIRYLTQGNRKGIWIATTSILFHFSFMLPVIVLVAYYILPNRTNLYFWFFVSTFFVSQMDITFFRDFLINHVPAIFTQKINSYTNTDYAESVVQKAANMNWYARLYGSFLQWVVIVFFSAVYYQGIYYLKNNRFLRPIFEFSLFFLGMVNLLSNIPSLGRFYSVGYLFAVAFIFFYLQFIPQNKILYKLNWFMTPMLFIYCIVSLRLAFDTIGVTTILGNPIFALFTNIDIALIQIIKH